MLEIIPKQMAMLSADSRRGFVERVAAFLRAEVPALAGEAPVALLAETERQIAKAWSYGLESEQAVAGYALAAALLGTDFDKASPPAAAVLNARDIGEAQKAEWLDSWMIELFAQLERD